MARVLLVGYLIDLLRERQAAFCAEGFTVTAASSVGQALRECEHSLFDALVLGHAVPERERNQIARAAKEQNRATKLLMLYLASIRNAELADALLHTTVRPEEICRTVSYLLSDAASQAG